MSRASSASMRTICPAASSSQAVARTAPSRLEMELHQGAAIARFAAQPGEAEGAAHGIQHLGVFPGALGGVRDALAMPGLGRVERPDQRLLDVAELAAVELGVHRLAALLDLDAFRSAACGDHAEGLVLGA